MRQPVILASASPQRSKLLEGIGVEFEVIPSSIDEGSHPELDPVRRAMTLATEKAQNVALNNPNRWVIGCDTLVEAADGTLLEKPIDEDDARRMLRLHSDSVSNVHSGLAVVSPTGEIESDVSSSKVHFDHLSDADIEWWIETGLWKDRSGGFQIDGPGQLMIKHLEGEHSSVVGLPINLLGKLLKKVGYPLH